MKYKGKVYRVPSSWSTYNPLFPWVALAPPTPEDLAAGDGSYRCIGLFSEWRRAYDVLLYKMFSEVAENQLAQGKDRV